MTRSRHDGARRGVTLQRRVDDIAVTDFFAASGREIATGLLSDLRTKAKPPATDVTSVATPTKVHKRTWVTRTGIHVDRIASAWLIRRYIDPKATFKYVPAKGYVPRKGELRFDMFEAEYSHEGESCTFETLLTRFDIKETGLRAIADVIHDIDLKESKFARPETLGFAACINGVCRNHRDDDERLAAGSVLLESLLAHFASQREKR